MATKKKAATPAPSSLAEWEKQATALFGTGIMTGTERMDPSEPVPVIPTGIPTLDMAFGVGGVPKGRIIELYGMEASGKTLISGLVAAAAQREGGNTGIVDAEQALSRGLMDLAGVDWNTLRVGVPDHGAQALDMAESMIKSKLFAVVTVDSVSALVTEQELDGQFDQQHMAPLAKLMAQGLRKIAPHMKDNDVTVIFINQLREKPGIAYGDPRYRPGGKSLPFYASVVVEVKVADRFKDPDGKQIGHRVKVTVKKNKVAAPHGEGEFNLYYRAGTHVGYGEVVAGVDVGEAYLTAAQKLGMANKVGSWWHLIDRETGEEIAKFNGDYRATTDIMEYQEMIDALVYEAL